MVSTVFSKKQFSFISIEDDVFNAIWQLAKSRNHLILYPVNSMREIENVSDLISEDWKKVLVSELQSEQKIETRSLTAKAFNGKKVSRVQFIEHLHGPVFCIKGQNREIVSSNFDLFLE